MCTYCVYTVYPSMYQLSCGHFLCFAALLNELQHEIAAMNANCVIQVTDSVQVERPAELTPPPAPRKMVYSRLVRGPITASKKAAASRPQQISSEYQLLRDSVQYVVSACLE